MARLKHFRPGDRVQGAKQRGWLGFYEKPGTVASRERSPIEKNFDFVKTEKWKRIKRKVQGNPV